MGEAVRGRSQDHTLGETGATTSDDQQVGRVRLTDREQPSDGVAQFLDGLVFDAIQIELFLELSQNPLLAFDEGR